LGRFDRESGQSRVPDPPERMTGVIKVVEMVSSFGQNSLGLMGAKLPKDNLAPSGH
jgi:hypothetical protein